MGVGGENEAAKVGPGLEMDVGISWKAPGKRLGQRLLSLGGEWAAEPERGGRSPFPWGRTGLGRRHPGWWEQVGGAAQAPLRTEAAGNGAGGGRGSKFRVRQMSQLFKP